MSQAIEQIIVDLHQQFEDWMARGEGDINDACLGLSAGFKIVSPDGNTSTKDEVISGLTKARGALPNIVFEITDFELVDAEGDLCVASYIEAQHQPTGSTERLTLAVFRSEANAPGGHSWIRANETWLRPPT